MKTLTIELPEPLVKQVERQGISLDALSALIIEFVQHWINEKAKTVDTKLTTTPLAKSSIDLWAELDKINAEDPIKIEAPERLDRPNTLLEMFQIY